MNRYFPALERTSWIDEHIDFFDTELFAPTRKNCMVLVVTALGSLAEDKSIGAPQSALSLNCIFSAQVFLACVSLGSDMTAVHCLILFSIYYLWMINPRQSYNFLCMAAMKLQIVIYRYLSF